MTLLKDDDLATTVEREPRQPLSRRARLGLAVTLLVPLAVYVCVLVLSPLGGGAVAGLAGVTLLLTGSLVYGLHRRHARAAAGEDGGGSVQPLYRVSRWRGRLIIGGVVLTVCSLVAVVVFQAVVVYRQQATGQAQSAEIDSLRAANPPSDFAVMCVGLWLAAGGGPGEADSFMATCRPGLDSASLAPQRANMLQVVQASAMPYPYSSAVADDPNGFSVLVAAHVLEWAATGAESSTGSWVDRGVLYYRAGIVVDEVTGAPYLTGWPRQVRAPQLPVNPPLLVLAPVSASSADPRTAMLSDFFPRYLVPGTDPGNPLLNYEVSGLNITPAASAEVKSAKLTAVGYGEPVGATTTALAEVLVTYMGGHQLVQSYPVELRQEGAAWLVAGLPPTAGTRVKQ